MRKCGESDSKYIEGEGKTLQEKVLVGLARWDSSAHLTLTSLHTEMVMSRRIWASLQYGPG
jgi:hypothetical protein